MSWRERLTSAEAWSDVAHNFRGDWQMLWKEITIGFLLAGFIGLLGNDFFNVLFVEDAPPLVKTLENVLVGPLIAVLSFVCSVGNAPLAAVLWSGGISFAGVIAFIFADLIVLPIVLAYRKYYGWPFAIRIVALMFVTMVLAALIVDGLFGARRPDPDRRAPRARDIFGSVQLDYKLVLNVGRAGRLRRLYVPGEQRESVAAPPTPPRGRRRRRAAARRAGRRPPRASPRAARRSASSRGRPPSRGPSPARASPGRRRAEGSS